MCKRQEDSFIMVTCEACQTVSQVSKLSLDFSRGTEKSQIYTRCEKCNSVINVSMSEGEKQRLIEAIFADLI